MSPSESWRVLPQRQGRFRGHSRVARDPYTRPTRDRDLELNATPSIRHIHGPTHYQAPFYHFGMDTQRDADLTRISVDSLQDWLRIKDSYTQAALASLDDELRGSRLAAERDVLIMHLQQVYLESATHRKTYSRFLKFVDRTFDMTRPNLRVNGRNFEELDTEEQGIVKPIIGVLLINSSTQKRSPLTKASIGTSGLSLSRA